MFVEMTFLFAVLISWLLVLSLMTRWYGPGTHALYYLFFRFVFIRNITPPQMLQQEEKNYRNTGQCCENKNAF